MPNDVTKDAAMMEEAIHELDPFQSIFNFPCWFNSDEEIMAIAAEIGAL